MATQLLVNVLSIGPLAGGASVTVAHGLKIANAGVVPTQAVCDRASPIGVLSANATTVTFTNTGASPASASFRVEHDHSVDSFGATPVYWQGYVTPTSLPPSGTANGDLAGTYPNPTVDGLAGNPLDTSAPAANDFLQYDGAVWRHIPVAPGTLPIAVYGQFYSNIDQAISDGGTGINTMYFESVASANGVTCVDPGTGFKTQITVAVTGVYAFTLSPQLFKSAGAGQGQVSFWLRKNGVDVPETASFVEVTNNEHMLPFIEILMPMTAGQYVEWVSHADKINCTLEQEPESFAPAIVRPAAPSVIAGVKLIGS